MSNWNFWQNFLNSDDDYISLKKETDVEKDARQWGDEHSQMAIIIEKIIANPEIMNEFKED